MSLNLGSASARFHHHGTHAPHDHQRGIRKSKSHAAFLTPLAQFVRNPLDTIASAVNRYNDPAIDAAEVAAAQAAAHREALYLRLQDVCAPDWWSSLSRANSPYRPKPTPTGKLP